MITVRGTGTAPLVTIRRSVSESRKTGWRWTCRACPLVRGRPRGGFHHDWRFTDLRGRGEHPSAWARCVRAAEEHIHANHSLERTTEESARDQIAQPHNIVYVADGNF